MIRGFPTRALGARWAARACAAALGLAPLAACSTDRETVLVVRTTLPDGLRDYVEETFEEAERDVDVRFIEGEDFLARAGATDGTDFDVWWGAPALTLHEAANEGLLLPHRPPWVSQPGLGEPDAQARWQVTLVSPFVIAFSRDQMTLSRAPTDWIDLFHYRWADEVHVLDPARTDEGAYFAASMIVEGLRDDADLDRGFDWLERLHRQVEVYAGDSEEVVRALGIGDALLGILPRYVVEAARADDEPSLYYRLPESGTPMLALGVAIMEDTEVEYAARRFVDHIGRPEVATEAKLHTRWQPAHGDVDMSRFPADFEIDQTWQPYLLAIDTVAADIEGWVQRWDADVRAR